MGDLDTVLGKLKEIKDEHGSRLSSIEEAVKNISTQAVHITHLQSNVTDLWVKYNDLCKPGGTLSNIEKYQASCPREEVKSLRNRLWTLMVSTVLMILASLWAIFTKKGGG